VNARRWGRFQGGGSSALVAFLMLLLVTLGALAMASSQANLRLAQKGVAWVKSYYALEAGGESLLDMISGTLSQHQAHTEDSDDELIPMLAQRLEEHIRKAGSTLPYGASVREVQVEPNGLGSITVKARLSRPHGSAEQHLLVGVELIAGSGEPHGWGFRILHWKQYQEPFEYESQLKLWSRSEDPIRHNVANER
jgi:hypothetical protein